LNFLQNELKLFIRKYKKEKISYSFIEKKPQNEELKLLIRRKFWK